MSDEGIHALLARGEGGRALELAKEHLAAARAKHDDAAVAEALLDEARAMWAKGDRDDAVIAVDEAISVARRAWGPRDARVGEAFELGAEIAAGADMPASADARFRTALDVLTEAGVEGAPRAHVLLHHGMFRAEQGDVGGAARAFRAALDAGREDPTRAGRELCAGALSEMARLALDAGRDDEARELADAALEAWVALEQARRYEVADAAAVVGEAALRAGEAERAEAFLATACAIYAGCTVDVKARRARAEAAHGDALAALGKAGEARDAYGRAMGLHREGSDARVELEERLLELARRTG